MGIKFECSECTHRIHVKAFLAGKRAICPHCGAKVQIPQEEGQNGSGLPAESNESAQTETAQTEMATSVANIGPSTAAASQPTAAVQPVSATPVSAALTTPESPTPVAPTPTAPVQAAVSDPISEAPSAVWYVRPKGGGQYGPAPGVTMRQWIDEGRVSADSLIWREGWEEWQSASVLITPAASAVAIGSVSAGIVTPPDVTDIAPSSGSTADGNRVTVRRKSNSLTVAMIVVLGIMAVSLVGILIWILSR